MKTPTLLASFAVAATASAAELKDPAEVAREWNESSANPPAFSAEPGPAGTIDVPKLNPDRARPFPRIRPNRETSPWGSIPRDKIYDAPNYRVPDVLPDNMPPGTKLWKYGGGTYYLLPAIPAREK